MSTLPTLTEQQIKQELKNLQTSKSYILQSGDLLDIKVYQEQDMDRTLRIPSNGVITFPLVGDIHIGGFTLTEAQRNLKNALKRYIKNPSVSILIKEYTNQTVYVLGQVEKPSSIQIPPEKSLTVLEAITSAGGFTDTAAPSRVKILRIQNGQESAIEVDITKITKEGNKQYDISLLPCDIVFVPQSLF